MRPVSNLSTHVPEVQLFPKHSAINLTGLSVVQLIQSVNAAYAVGENLASLKLTLVRIELHNSNTTGANSCHTLTTFYDTYLYSLLVLPSPLSTIVLCMKSSFKLGN